MPTSRTITVLIVASLVFSLPLAWGCELSDAAGCSMSDCPMAVAQRSSSCHDSAPEPERQGEGCDSNALLTESCCLRPADQEPAAIDVPLTQDLVQSLRATSPKSVVASRPFPRPDRFQETIASRNHRLGRFTLHSSLLL